MSQCVFSFKGNDIIIQCSEDQLMDEICKSFATKAQIDSSKSTFLYNGAQLDMKSSFNKQANNFDKNRKQMNIVVTENQEKDSPKEIMRKDLMKKGEEILKRHLDGRGYKEEKVNEWIKTINEDFEKYFYEKYPKFNLFVFCLVCSKNTLYYCDDKSILLTDEEAQDTSVFNTDDLHSVLYFFSFKNFSSTANAFLEPRIISLGNKLLYEIFDERKYGKALTDCCVRLNKELNKSILEVDRRRRCLNMTFAFKKPLKDFSYNFRMKSSFDLARIIQTFFTADTEVYHLLFMISNDK